MVLPEIKAKAGYKPLDLYTHLLQVKQVIIKFATSQGVDEVIASHGAILHDIGKAHPVFRDRLNGIEGNKTFRHELSSLFFLSLFPEEEHIPLIEMIVGHHRSIYKDRNGILDLEKGEENYIEYHLGDWESWSTDALMILKGLGVKTHAIKREEALKNFEKVLGYCNEVKNKKGISLWRGLLMGADHYASALLSNTENKLNLSFEKPNLSFFNRTHALYPLSTTSSLSNEDHTLVTAPTGAGKTDFLFRRCKGRVFYVLPFQASINAMYKRLQKDLKKDNPSLDLRVLHAASSCLVDKNKKFEGSIQRLIGSSVKVLTPFQLASLVLCDKGHEAQVLDIKGNDVILDEIHTYSGTSQAIVLKIIEALVSLGCRVHVGTATMPTTLYHKIKNILGNVYEVKLNNEDLMTYNRHNVFKINGWDAGKNIIKEGVSDRKKILIICNRVLNAQKIYENIKTTYPEVQKLLLHSRFKRGDRVRLEKELMGLDDEGNKTGCFNTSNEGCIVVSTQVVEVSLDISFDLMITECAPIDALIQRFGRINRVRNDETIGILKPVYVLPPPENEGTALPYSLEILNKTYNTLPDKGCLEENTLQDKIDYVFNEDKYLDIEQHVKFKGGDKWNIHYLRHSTPLLMEMMQVDTVNGILNKDKELYKNIDYNEKIMLEIPVRLNKVRIFEQYEFGTKPFIIPDKYYDDELGLTL